MPKKRGWWMASLGCVLAVSIFYLWAGTAWPHGFFQKSDRPYASDDAQTVRVGSQRLDRTVIATGVIRPVVGAEIQVGSRLSGTVQSLRVRVGDPVVAGQVLARLDPSAIEAEVAEARAELELAMPRLALAESTLERRRSLFESGLLAAQELELAERDLAVERSRRDAARARLRSAEIRLGYTRITAPIDGLIAEISTREGETVAAGFSAPTFVTILDPSRLEVLAYVDETDIGRITPGQRASFTVDTYPDTAFEATVRGVEPKAVLQGSVVNYGVRLDLELRDGLVLRPEMTAHVKVVIEEGEPTLTVPRSALLYRDGRPLVVVRRQDRWQEQGVRTGQRSANGVEITEGLDEGDTLLLHPSDSPGDRS